MQEDTSMDFNFWPSFADLMLALVLILVLLLFLVIMVISVGSVNLSHVEKKQLDMISAIATKYGSKSQKLEDNLYGISINVPNNYDIVIKNEPVLQRITFSDKILFKPDDDHLNDIGEDVLRVVGESLKQQLSSMKEIQIQGHADIVKSNRFPSNVHLASARAISVFSYFQNKVGINPSEYLMSVTSFGEFKPVQRSEKDQNYDLVRLQTENSTVELRGKNRRIEILLFYQR